MRRVFPDTVCGAVLVSAVLGVLSLPSNALANSLPPARFAADDDFVQLGTTAGGFTHKTCDSEGDCELATIKLGYSHGSGTVNVVGATSGPYLGPKSYGEGEVLFYFDVVGSYPGLVPVDVTGSGSVSATTRSGGRASADASLTVDVPTTYSSSSLTICTPTSEYCGGPSSFTDSSVEVWVTPNVVGPYAAYVELYAEGSAFGGSYTASLDPMVSFAPGFDSTGLSLVFSPNPLGASVPEPGTLALLGSGLLGVAGALRRKRQART